MSLGLQVVTQTTMIQAVIYRITVEPASDIADVNKAYALRKMWSKMLKVPISSILLVEAVIAAVVNEPPTATLFNVTDPANTIGNPAGVNTTAAIVHAAQNARSQRILFAGALEDGFHHRRLAGMEMGSDSAKLDLLRAAPRVPSTGSTDISFNILSSNKKDATALAALIIALTPADIEEGISSTIALLSAAHAPPGSPEYLTRRLQTANASSLLNVTMGVDYSSVQVVELSFVTKVWGVFLDFLLKNIRYVIGGTVGLIVYNVVIAAYHHYLSKRRKQLAEAALAAAVKAVEDAKRGLKFRILRARFRVLFRKISRSHKDNKRAAERQQKTATREAKIAIKSANAIGAPPPPPTAPPLSLSSDPYTYTDVSRSIGFARLGLCSLSTRLNAISDELMSGVSIADVVPPHTTRVPVEFISAGDSNAPGGSNAAAFSERDQLDEPMQTPPPPTSAPPPQPARVLRTSIFPIGRGATSSIGADSQADCSIIFR
jgi:hypothetical protein